jgi:methylmalonyl-CoA mutase cobalamin-binding subunit
LVIVPLVGEGDEVVGRVLARLLEARGIGSRLLPWRTLRSEKVEHLKESGARCIVLSTIESRAQVAVGNVTRSIQSQLPDAVILIGLWSLPPAGAARLIRRIRESSVHGVYTNLDEAVQGVSSLAFPPRPEPHPEQVPH